MSHMNHYADPSADPVGLGADTGELHHGDLRKAAYLKRRADYQMQANAPRAQQTGSSLTLHPSRRPG